MGFGLMMMFLDCVIMVWLVEIGLGIGHVREIFIVWVGNDEAKSRKKLLHEAILKTYRENAKVFYIYLEEKGAWLKGGKVEQDEGEETEGVNSGENLKGKLTW